MMRDIRFLLVLMLTLVMFWLASVVVSVDEWERPAPIEPVVPSPMAEAEMLAGLATAGRMQQAVERPLFWMTRRPVPEEEKEELPEAPQPEEDPLDKMRLLGTVGSPESPDVGQVVILLEQDPPEVIRLTVGERWDSLILVSVAPRSATFAHLGVGKRVLEMEYDGIDLNDEDSNRPSVGNGS